MTKLRESARGQDCHLRLPGICNHDPETTVLAHIRRGFISGTALKPVDSAGVFACDACHSAIDGRVKYSAHLAAHIDAYILEGHLRTLDYWWRNGILKA